MTVQKERIDIITPKGVAIYPKLNTPDTKFDAAGVYDTKLAFDGDDAEVQAFIAKAEELRDRFFDATVAQLTADKKAGKAKLLTKVPFLKPEMDDESGDETGRLILRAKMKASGVSKKTGKPWTMKPRYFSASGKPLQNPPRIGGGSELKLAVILEPYLKSDNNTVGVSARLEAVQIITLVSGGGRSFSSFGFAAEEGDEIEDEAEAPASGAEGGAASDEDDDI